MGILSKWLKKRANISDPNIPLTPANIDGYYQSGSAGVEWNTVIPPHPAVWQAVSMISGDIAKMPLQVYRKTGEASRVVDTDHRAYKPVARCFHPLLQAYLGWRRLILHALIWNRGFAWIRQDPMGGIELINLLPDRTTWDPYNGVFQTEISREYEGGGPTVVWLYPSEVLMVEGLAWSSYNEIPLTRMAQDSWSVGLAQIQFQAKLFQQGMFPAGFLEIPTTMSKRAADNLEEGFKKRHNNPNSWFKTVILRDGAKFHSAQINPADGQANEAGEENARAVARWFNIPPSKLGVRDSSSYGEKAADNSAYYDMCLSSWMAAVKSECWMKLLSEEEKDADSHEFDYDTRALFATNPETQASIGQIEFNSGFISVNEYRAQTNRNPLDKDFRVMPANAVVEGDEPEPESDDEEPESDNEINEDRLFRVIELIRRENSRNKPERFIKWFDKNEAELRLTHAEMTADIEAALHLPGTEATYRIREILNAYRPKL